MTYADLNEQSTGGRGLPRGPHGRAPVALCCRVPSFGSPSVDPASRSRVVPLNRIQDAELEFPLQGAGGGGVWGGGGCQGVVPDEAGIPLRSVAERLDARRAAARLDRWAGPAGGPPPWRTTSVFRTVGRDRASQAHAAHAPAPARGGPTARGRDGCRRRRIFCTIALFHTYGMGCCLLAAAEGAPLVLSTTLNRSCCSAPAPEQTSVRATVSGRAVFGPDACPRLGLRGPAALRLCFSASARSSRAFKAFTTASASR